MVFRNVVINHLYFSSKDEICSNTKLQLVQFLFRIVNKINVINPRKKGLPRSVYINDLLNSIIALFFCQFFQSLIGRQAGK